MSFNFFEFQNFQNKKSFFLIAFHYFFKVDTTSSDESKSLIIKGNKMQRLRRHNTNLNVEFVEQPQDAFLSGSLPVLVECMVKNAGESFVECQNRIRNDLTRNVSIRNDIKYEKLSLLINRKDFESENSDERLACRCVAYSHLTNQKYFSDRAIITNSCKF